MSAYREAVVPYEDPVVTKKKPRWRVIHLGGYMHLQRRGFWGWKTVVHRDAIYDDAVEVLVREAERHIEREEKYGDSRIRWTK